MKGHIVEEGVYKSNRLYIIVRPVKARSTLKRRRVAMRPDEPGEGAPFDAREEGDGAPAVSLPDTLHYTVRVDPKPPLDQVLIPFAFHVDFAAPISFPSEVALGLVVMEVGGRGPQVPSDLVLSTIRCAR